MNTPEFLCSLEIFPPRQEREALTLPTSDTGTTPFANSNAETKFDTLDFEVEYRQGITSVLSVSGTTSPSSGFIRRERPFRRTLAASPVTPGLPGEWFSAAGRLRSEGPRRRYPGLRCARGVLLYLGLGQRVEFAANVDPLGVDAGGLHTAAKFALQEEGEKGAEDAVTDGLVAVV